MHFIIEFSNGIVQLSSSGDEEPAGHSSWAPWSTEIYRSTKSSITATLHRSGLYGGRPNSILSSVNTKEKTLEIYKKAPKGPSDSEKQDSLIWWTSILSIVFEGNQLCSSPADHPKSKMCWKQPHAVGLFFRGRDWGTHQKRKSTTVKTQSRAFRTSDWVEGLLSNRTMTLSKQQEWLYTTLWMSLSGPASSHCLDLNPIKYFWRNLKMCVCPHPTWKSLRGEEVRRQMADNCQMLMNKACHIKQTKDLRYFSEIFS